MIQYLKKLLKALSRSSQDKTQIAPISQNEQVARFIYQKNDWSRQSSRPKPKVFLPMKEAGQWETSVCRVCAVSEQRIWEIANQARSPLRVLACAELSANSVMTAGLFTEAAPDFEANYPEHAVIVGWPDEKEKQMALAIELVSTAELVLTPSSKLIN
jgi:hypothetical protein